MTMARTAVSYQVDGAESQETFIVEMENYFVSYTKESPSEHLYPWLEENASHK